MAKMEIKFNIVRSYDTEKRHVLNKPIFFMHVPKSGGTTIDHIFATLSSITNKFEFHRYKYNNINEYKTLVSPNSRLEKPKFISGHLNYDFCKNLKDCFRCAIVREPTERVISNYKFSIHLKKKTPKEYSFEKFIEDEISSYRDNLITRQFAGLYGEKKPIGRNKLIEAIKNIELFDALNISKNWDKFLSDIITRFNLPSVIYSRFQQHNYNFNFNLQQQHLDLIHKYFTLDLELYSKIKKNITSKNFKKSNTYNKNFCLVSPYIKTENKLYSSEDISRLLNINKNLKQIQD